MAGVIFESDALIGETKAGVIKPDANGYYELVLGAFNYYNNAGHYYPVEPFKQLLSNSGSLMRRIKNRTLNSELGHPRFTSNMSKTDILLRVMDIVEQNICAHIKSIELDDTRVTDKSGNKVISTIGLVKPSGPHGDSLAKQLENKDENVCFSIRSITNDSINHATGTRTKHVTEVVTWDKVNECGIDVATKYHSPSMESIHFTREDVKSALDKAVAMGVGMESHRDTLYGLYKTMREPITAKQVITAHRPRSARWT